MYQFTGKLKIVSIALILIGALGIGYGFLTAPSNLEETKEIMAHQGAHEEEHSEGEKVSSTQTSDEIHKDNSIATEQNNEEENDVAHSVHSDTITASDNHDSSGMHKSGHVDQEMNAHGEHGDDSHAEHVMHQLQNRPWSAVYVALLFFLGISLLVLAFYAAQRVAQSGWSVVLFRVMEAITANIIPTSIIMVVIIVLSALHYNHLFSWMTPGTFDPTSENYDAIVDGKSWWINLPGWTIRGIVYLALWNAFRWVIRRNSIAEDTADDNGATTKKNYNISVVFLVVFMLTESMMSWDWIMGLDPHWFSTLFGWYVLASLLVSALTVVAFVTIYLRSKNAIPGINDSHIHDLAKFMFGFSVFWTYLWFAQFMLIWYANIPEEGTYFIARFNEYKLPFFAMVVMNFVFPVLLLLNSDFKSRPWFVLIGGIVILAGHYIDIFIMVMPGTVGSQWGFGIPEFGAILFFIGIFIYAVFSSFAKANPIPKGNPYLQESEHFHYYNIEHTGDDSDHH